MNNQFLNNKTLGKGLNSLIPNKNAGSSGFSRPVTPAAYFPKNLSGVRNQILHIPPALIELNPYQPRQTFGDHALAGLKASIKEYGILQPLVVSQTIAGKYELIAGERRLRAARELDLKTVPVILRSTKDLEKLELSLIENIQREDLNPIEKAMSFKQLIENFKLTQEEASRRLGIPRSTLNNTLRYLNLPTDIQLALAAGKISEGQAKLILGLAEEKKQVQVFRKVEQGGMTVKDVEREVKRIQVKAHSRQVIKDPTHKHYEEQLQSTLGTRVSIRKRGAGGVMEIEYYSEEELESIVHKISR